MLTLGFLALSYLMAAKNKLFPDRKMKEPERKDNEKISANNSNIMDKRSTVTTPLQQAAKLLERSQQLLRAANSEAAVHATTAARVRRMSTAELRRDPVLWVAYTRGWDDRAAVFGKATNVGPKPAVTDRSQSPRRPVQPAGIPRPQSARLLRPPPQPLMAVMVPRPRSFLPPAPPATRKVDQKSDQRPTAEQTTTAPPQNSRQRRKQFRMREYRGQKKAAKPTTSQQYRLEKPAPSTTQPAPGPKSLEATSTPVPEAKTPEVAMPPGQAEATEQPATATSIPVDIKISPDEELLCDMMDVGPPDDVDKVFQITPSQNTPLQKPATYPHTHPPEAAGQPPSLFCD